MTNCIIIVNEINSEISTLMKNVCVCVMIFLMNRNFWLQILVNNINLVLQLRMILYFIDFDFRSISSQYQRRDFL